MKLKICVILVVAFAACLGVFYAPSARSQQQPADDIDKLNSAPQKRYPRFTLEEQTKAMQTLAELRRAERKNKLRENTEPADWIAVAYHGLVLDANLDVIDLTPENTSKIQRSIFSVLQRSEARQKARTRYGSDLSPLFNAGRLNQPDRAAIRDVVLSSLLDETGPALKDRYAWRLRLLQKNDLAMLRNPLPLSARSNRLLRQLSDFDDLTAPTQDDDEYVASCRAASVPIPPNWPDPRWVSQGALNFVFISSDLNAEVFAYKDPNVAGVCYALPRRDSTGAIILLGIICQSDSTGKACFWDNKDRENDKPITGPDIQLNINAIGNGLTLGETCTECHRGDNVFNIHPGTALELESDSAVGGPYDTTPEVRYTPIGREHWNNAGPLTLSNQPSGQRSCTACHNFPELTAKYCNAVLGAAVLFTMPPFGPTRAGWPGSDVPVHPGYASHIGQLNTLCSMAP